MLYEGFIKTPKVVTVLDLNAFIYRNSRGAIVV